MKKKRRIWIFAVALAMAAVQGTVFAEEQKTESSVEAITEITEAAKALDTEVLVETTKSELNLPEETKQISAEEREETGLKKNSTKQVKTPVKKIAEGQTLLDVSQGSITITSAGATGGVQAVRHL